MDGALEGMMEATEDTYAYYFDEEESEAYEEESDGYYVGIGVMVGTTTMNIQVSKVFCGFSRRGGKDSNRRCDSSADGTSWRGLPWSTA